MKNKRQRNSGAALTEYAILLGTSAMVFYVLVQIGINISSAFNTAGLFSDSEQLSTYNSGGTAGTCSEPIVSTTGKGGPSGQASSQGVAPD